MYYSTARDLDQVGTPGYPPAEHLDLLDRSHASILHQLIQIPEGAEIRLARGGVQLIGPPATTLPTPDRP